jgi:hypothetical protein
MNNTIHIHYEDQVVNAAQKITGVDCGNRTKHLYTHTHTHTHTVWAKHGIC